MRLLVAPFAALAIGTSALTAQPAWAACEVDLVGTGYGGYDYCSDYASEATIVVASGTVWAHVRCINDGYVPWDVILVGPSRLLAGWGPPCHAQLTLTSLTDGGAYAIARME